MIVTCYALCKVTHHTIQPIFNKATCFVFSIFLKAGVRADFGVKCGFK